MSNLHFKNVLGNILIASTENNITVTCGFINISGLEFLAKLRVPHTGEKNGSHYLRSSLKIDDKEKCLPRNNINLESQSSLIILDCDKRINKFGEILEGAPDPLAIINVLKEFDIGFILHGTHSYYSNNGKGNRYRILALTSTPYKKEELAPTIESIINRINATLQNELLFNSQENKVYAQGFFYPRIPVNCTKDILYFENLDGKTIDVCAPKLIISNHDNKSNTLPKPEISNLNLSNNVNYSYQISAIHAFNQQYPLPELLLRYGYKKVYATREYEKWIHLKESTSGIAGITVWKSKFFSHHADSFNDGKPKDAFDLFKVREGLNYRDAVMKASKMTIAPDGSSVDAWNKRAWLKNKSKQNKEVL